MALATIDAKPLVAAESVLVKQAEIDAKPIDAKPVSTKSLASFADILTGIRPLPGSVYVSATANGYLRLRTYDKQLKKWYMIGYLGALRPKRSGTKRVPKERLTQYEQRNKRRRKG